MKALMFGWEFPPHILGELGTASYGLPKVCRCNPIWKLRLSSQNHGAERPKFLHHRSNQIPVVWKDVNWDHVNSRIGNYEPRRLLPFPQ